MTNRMVSWFGRHYRILADRSLGKAGDSKDKQTAAAQSAEIVPTDQTKDKTTVATPDKPVPPKATDSSKTNGAAGGAKAPDAPGDKSADSAPSPIKAESTQTQKTTQEEVAAKSELKKDPAASSNAAATSADTTPPPPVPDKSPAPHVDATVTKLDTPISEPAASAKSNGESEVPNAPDADAKKAGEAPAQAEAGTVKKPAAAAAESVPQPPNQDGEAGGEKPTAAKGDDAKPEGPVKPTLRLDHIRETSTASTMSASSPGTPGDETPSSSVEKDDEVDASGVKLSKNQRKRIRDKAKKQAQKGEKNSPRASSGATSNSVDNSVVQETKPVATVPVDTPVNVPVGEGEGVLVDKKTGGGEDDAPVAVEKTADEIDEDEWEWFQS
jgi:hypothetical protein